MPPNPKINKNELLEAGLSIIRVNGFENVNARSLAQALSCSTHPIFRIYKDMEGIKEDLFAYAEHYCNAYLERNMTAAQQNMALGLGLAYVNFARQEPNVFKFLFMSHQFKKSHAARIWESEENAPMLRAMAAAAEISFAGAQAMMKKLWLLTHGMASIIAANGPLFSPGETARILTEAFTGFLMQIRYESGGVFREGNR